MSVIFSQPNVSSDLSGLVTRHQIVSKQILVQLLSYDTFDDF